MNKAILMGKLADNPRFTPNDKGGVASFQLVLSERWKDKSGKPMERIERVNIVAFGKLAPICSDFLRKGRMAYVEGRVQTRKYQDQSGSDRYVTEVVADEVQFMEGEPRAERNSP